MISQERLRQVLDYNPETGLFHWKVRTATHVKVGDLAGSLDDKGYVLIRIDTKIYRAHRLAFLWVLGRWPEDQVDHINLARSDNRWGNLRESSCHENMCNRTKQINNTSGFKGVTFEKKTGAWKAGIGVEGRFINLGRFPTPESAHVAYVAAAKKYHRGFARVV